MSRKNPTIYDPGAAKSDGSTTILDGAKLSIATDPCYEQGDTILETYRVESEAIESGGMGRVWRVHHTGWNVDLAMKRPRAEHFADEKSKLNFIRECDTWIKLGLHPNIVSCYYVRLIDGIPTIFSEWMDGGDLAHAIDGGGLYEGLNDDPGRVQERILDIAIQIARGLHYAHEARDEDGKPKQIVHQDVKPGNVLLTKDGEAKVGDFGLARARAAMTQGKADQSNSTESGDSTRSIMSPSGGCTPAYCSPEQSEHSKNLTLQTDIYSWAVSVLEMYKGDRPWANGVVAGIDCRMYLDQAKVPVPAPMKDLLERCLACEPENRPQGFGLILAELLAIYRLETGEAYPREDSRAAADTADSLNNRALSMLDLGKTEEAERLWERALHIEPDNLDCVYNQSLYLWRCNRISGEKARLLCEVAAVNQPYRQLASSWSELLQGESGMSNDQFGARLTCITEELQGPISLSRDGSLLLVGYVLLKLVDVRNDTIVQDYKTVGESFSFVKLLSDGFRFLTVGEKTVRVWDIQSGESRVLCLPMSLYYLSVDETILYVYDRNSNTLRGWNIDSGECEITVDLPQTDPYLLQNRFCVSPNRATLYKTGKNLLSTIDIASGRITGTYPLNDEERYVSVSFDGTRLYLHSFSDIVEVWDAANMALIHQFEVKRMNMNSLCYSKDTRVMAVSDSWNFIHIWQNTHAGCLASLKAQTSLVDFTISGDGNVIVSQEARNREYYFRVWRTSPIQPATYEISRAIGIAESSKKAVLFDNACSLAQSHIDQKNIAEALLQIQRAFSICGSISNEQIRRLRGLAGKDCIRRGVLGSYVLREQTGIEYSSEAICLSADGQSYFTANFKDHTFLQWDFRGGSLIRTFGKYEYGYQTIYMAADDRYLYTRDKSGAFCVWEISRGELISKRMPMGGNCELCFSQDRHKVLFTNGEEMVLQKSLDGTIVQNFKKHEYIYFDSIRSVSFSPDERFAMVDDMRRNTVVWDVQKGDLCYQTCVPYQVYTEFSLDGTILAMKTDDDRSGYLYDTNTFGNKMDIVDIQSCGVFESFACDPAEIAKASTIKPKNISQRYKILANNRFLGLWDLKKKERVLGIFNSKALEQDFSCYCLSPDERWLFIGSTDGAITIWGIEYEYVFPGWSNWDEEAQPYLDIFLTLHPNWEQRDFDGLIVQLQNSGFGWLRPEGVKKKLAEMNRGE